MNKQWVWTFENLSFTSNVVSIFCEKEKQVRSQKKRAHYQQQYKCKPSNKFPCSFICRSPSCHAVFFLHLCKSKTVKVRTNLLSAILLLFRLVPANAVYWYLKLQFSRVHSIHEYTHIHSVWRGKKIYISPSLSSVACYFILLNDERKVNRRGLFACWMFFVTMAALSAHNIWKFNKREMCVTGAWNAFRIFMLANLRLASV